MSDQQPSAAQITDELLSEAERIICQDIAESGDGLANHRAAALLALDQGATRAEAGEQSGLSLGQVKYLLATFRQKGLGMFAEGAPGVALSQTDEVYLGEGAIKEEKAKTGKKGKKKKQTKKKKGTKKDKKSKKTKADKSKGKKGKAKKDKKSKSKTGKKKSKK